MRSHQEIARHLGGHHHHDHEHPHAHGGGAPEYPPVLVELLRGGLPESAHRGAVAVAGPDGRYRGGLGHPATPTFMRTAAKPLQAVLVVESGAAARFGFLPAELAAMCGSREGGEARVAAVRSILAKAGLGEGLLACGAVSPRRGEAPEAIRHAGAGEHAAMLALCVHLGLPMEGYQLPTHPLQRRLRAEVARLTGYPEEQIGLGVEDSGAPAYRLPLLHLAGAYARLAAPERAGLPAATVAAIRELMAACLAHPALFAGEGRPGGRLMRALPGRLLAKAGAEGTYALALPEAGLGVALKLEDGNPRALAPVVCELLHQLGLLGHAELEGPLADLHRPRLRNGRGEAVAELRPSFHLAMV